MLELSRPRLKANTTTVAAKIREQGREDEPVARQPAYGGRCDRPRGIRRQAQGKGTGLCHRGALHVESSLHQGIFCAFFAGWQAGQKNES